MLPILNPSQLPDLDRLSLVEQISQMLVVRTCGMLYDHQIQYPRWELTRPDLQRLIGEFGVGGVIVMGGSAAEVALKVQEMQSWAKIPLLVAADVEEGVGQRFSGATWFPPPMALQDVSVKYAEAMGRITAAESLAIGINWMLAPIVDVNNNPENPVINVRAFGITVGEVMGATRAFIAGAQQFPILTTAKHFPGHGDTAVDSHLQTPMLPHDHDRFENIEFPPFRNAIAAGVDAVMSAHIFAPQLDPQNIATLSPPILTDILRGEMGFEGLITTDALMMAGVANLGNAGEIAIKAVLAGADILLMPTDAIATIEALAAAVESGQISRDRIRESVQRIWQAKQKVCGSLPDLVPDLVPNLHRLGNPENLQVAQEIASRAITVHSQICHTAENVDLRKLNLLIVDDTLTCSEFLTARSPAVVLPKAQGYHRIVTDGLTMANLDCWQGDRFTQVLIQIFSRGNPFRGNTDFHEQLGQIIEQAIALQKLEAVVVYGSPYCLDHFLAILPSDIPWGFAYSQQPEAQTAVLQQIGLAK